MNRHLERQKLLNRLNLLESQYQETILEVRSIVLKRGRILEEKEKIIRLLDNNENNLK
jgi:hypothetical protein